MTPSCVTRHSEVAARARMRSTAHGLELRARLEALLVPAVVDVLEELVAEWVKAELATAVEVTNERTWLTLAEAGERLGVSGDAIRMRVKRGRLEARRQGRRLYVSAKSVETLA